MIGSLIGIIIGGAAILLGVKGFAPEGLPFSKDQRLTGTTGRLVGTTCILFGLLFIALCAYPFLPIG